MLCSSGAEFKCCFWGLDVSYILDVIRLLGSDVFMSYDCGEDKTLTFNNSQTPCFFYAGGKVNGRIISVNQLNAGYNIDVGCFFWSQNGTLMNNH